ncbi:glycosyltransferase 87 family protein [Frankia sp. AgB32]|uniref:glycosyltransferase 87 family protein n=1 Tax=Frankia sp. AgB32 TaxID=631119 RepID=UPI002010AFA7|nr:glycosyltransferase 87 family protein [Frankia sp. AgB32]MCK9893045.1 glycosyltransferase 87 family protein [Frankia sp. AgB32]
MPTALTALENRGPATPTAGAPARSPGWRPAALVAAAVGLAGVLVTEVAVRQQPGYLVSRPALLWLTMLWWALGMITAALLVFAAPRRLAVGLLLGATVAIHAVALTGGPRLSDDLYRYAWDGRVQAAGIDPYRYGPLAPELDGQRDEWLFPNSAGCTAEDPLPHCTRLNYPRAHTIYPPVAQAYFTAVHLLPGPPREHKLQLYASLGSLALVGGLMAALRSRGRDPRLAAFYVLTPLAGIDAGSDAHVDVLGALLVLGALAALRTPHPRGPRSAGAETSKPARTPEPAEAAAPAEAAEAARPAAPTRRRVWLAGALLGAAVAVKLYPALLVPAMIGRGRRYRPVSLLCAAGAVVGLTYLPHVLAVGTAVIGFLPQYLNVEGYDQGSRFLLLAGVGLHGTAAKAVAVGALAAVTVAVLRCDPHRVPPERAALWLVGAAFLTATPAQPWYGILLATLAIVAGRLEWLAVAAAAYPLYISLFTEVPGDAWTLRVTAYAVAALIVLAGTVVRRVGTPRLRPSVS